MIFLIAVFLIATIVGIIAIVISSLPVAISSLAITIFGWMYFYVLRGKEI